MNLQTKLFPWSVVLNLIFIALLFWMWYENGRGAESADRHWNETIQQAEKRKDQDSVEIARLRHGRDSAYKVASEQRSLYQEATNKRQGTLKELMALRTALGIKPDTITIEIEKEATAQRTADSLEIVRLETKMLADSTSFEKEIFKTNDRYLQQVVISDQHFEKVQELEQELTRVEKLARFFGISAGTLVVVVTILAIAL